MKLLILIAYFIVLITIGFVCRQKATDVNGFVLGGRSVGPWLTAFAYGTSYFSAVVFVGYAGQFGWRFGIAATWAGIGNALIGSLLAWVILGRRTRIMTQHLDSATMPQFFGERFQSKSLKIAASVIIFIFLIPYTASLYNGLSRLFGMAFHIDYSVCIVLMAILTAIYVIAGGYMATAINDFIQGIIMLAGIIAIIVAVLHSKGGFMAALDGLGHVSDPTVSSTPGVFGSFFGPDPVSLLSVVILTSLGTWGLPQMVQKFYAIDNEDSIKKGTIISTIFALVVSGGCYFLGGFGRLFSDKIDIAANGNIGLTGVRISADSLQSATKSTGFTVGTGATGLTVGTDGKVTIGGTTAQSYTSKDGSLTTDNTTKLYLQKDGSVTNGSGKAVYVEADGDFTTDAATKAATTTDPLKALDEAISQIDKFRSSLGAIQNRLDSAVTNLNNTTTNLSEAQSRIQDADYATEVSNMSKAQIIQQAGNSVLAKANQVPQQVLSLLQG